MYSLLFEQLRVALIGHCLQAVSVSPKANILTTDKRRVVSIAGDLMMCDYSQFRRSEPIVRVEESTDNGLPCILILGDRKCRICISFTSLTAISIGEISG